MVQKYKDPTNYGSNKFTIKKTLNQKNLGQKKFESQKKGKKQGWVKMNFGPTKIWLQKMLVQKFFLVKNNYWSKNILGQ